ncbi:hypothetical protein RIF29_27147 [Crotalaria pallida]|uniref:Transmembrane protein n=1 Tax=Crotalaria pallida TaxID=3830 RepID=A0AAN9ENJ9_CROPI
MHDVRGSISALGMKKALLIEAKPTSMISTTRRGLVFGYFLPTYPLFSSFALSFFCYFILLSRTKKKTKSESSAAAAASIELHKHFGHTTQ